MSCDIPFTSSFVLQTCSRMTHTMVERLLPSDLGSKSISASDRNDRTQDIDIHGNTCKCCDCFFCQMHPDLSAFHTDHMYACFHKRHKAQQVFPPWGLVSRCSLALCYTRNTMDADKHDTRCTDDLGNLCQSLPPACFSGIDRKNAPSCTKDITCGRLAKHAAPMLSCEILPN